MKIIIEDESQEDEVQRWYGKRIKACEVNKELVDFFYNEIFNKQFLKFLTKNEERLMKKYLDAKTNNSHEAMELWRDAIKKYGKKFDQERDKYYFVNGKFYSYHFKYTIEVIEYELEEIETVINSLARHKSILTERNLIQRIMNKNILDM